MIPELAPRCSSWPRVDSTVQGDWNKWVCALYWVPRLWRDGTRHILGSLSRIVVLALL